MVDRLLRLIKEKGLTVSTVERKLGFGNGAIKRFSTNSPSIDKIILLSNFLNVSVEYILFGKEQQNDISDDMSQLLSFYKALNEREKGIVLGKAETLAELAAERAAEQEKITNVKQNHNRNAKKQQSVDTYEIIYYDYAASAGTGLFLDETIAESIIVRNTPEAQQADYAIPVSGDSMEDDYHNNDIVLVKSCPCVCKGEVGIFLINGNVYIKEYGGKLLISHNPKYAPIDLSKQDSVVCLGKVLGIAEVVS